MSNTKYNVKKILKQIRGKEICMSSLETIIAIHIGADKRTVNRYIEIMKKWGLIKMDKENKVQVLSKVI